MGRGKPWPVFFAFGAINNNLTSNTAKKLPYNDTAANDFESLLRAKADIIAAQPEGNYIMHGGWNNHQYGFTVGVKVGGTTVITFFGMNDWGQCLKLGDQYTVKKNSLSNLSFRDMGVVGTSFSATSGKYYMIIGSMESGSNAGTCQLNLSSGATQIIKNTSVSDYLDNKNWVWHNTTMLVVKATAGTIVVAKSNTNSTLVSVSAVEITLS